MSATPTLTAVRLADGLTAKFANEGQFCSKFFSVQAGTRYDKVFQGRSAAKADSIHCFVDRETGAVLKAAGLNKPAPHVRYATVDAALAVADVYGGYLYLSGR